MKNTRIIAKWVIGPAVAAALVLGSTSVPAQAKDSGWNGTSVKTPTTVSMLKDSGWNGT
jgi:hypothetical protein